MGEGANVNTAAKSTDIEVAREFAGKVREAVGEELRRAVLFGSRAKGLALEGSDYDILLVVKHRTDQIVDSIYEVVMDFLLERKIDVSLKIYSEDRFVLDLERSTPFAAEVAATGVSL